MRLESEELIKEFFETIKKDYPNLSYDQIKEICHGPWKYTKKEIESGEFPKIGLKYFGTFLVYPKKANAQLIALKKRFDNKNINSKQYFSIKSNIEKFLSNEENTIN